MEEKDSNIHKYQQHLDAELNEINEGNANFYSVEEVEDRLDKIIMKHEYPH